MTPSYLNPVLLMLLAVQLFSHDVYVSGQQQTPGTCPLQPSVPNWYIDSSTPSIACSKRVCIGSYQQCTNPATAESETRNLALVFSDEFNGPRRDMQYQYGNRTWTAMDMYHSSTYDEDQVYKPNKVTVVDGALQIRMDGETNTGAQQLPLDRIHVVTGSQTVASLICAVKQQ
eukprot:GHUV01057101.1.p1 GENE.GHUV01057101.1~~GHUV01057101.1.p1  ORF type:complete len:173 (+),score=35.59 GHUV01057101.1:445-963(+)